MAMMIIRLRRHATSPGRETITRSRRDRRMIEALVARRHSAMRDR
jgi:hypothetical protein